MIIKEQTDLSKLRFRGYAIKYTMNGKQYGIISFDDCGDTEDFYNMILNYNKMLSDNIISDEEYEDQISFIWGRANADYDDLDYSSFENAERNDRIQYFIDLIDDSYYVLINKQAVKIL